MTCPEGHRPPKGHPEVACRLPSKFLAVGTYVSWFLNQNSSCQIMGDLRNHGLDSPCLKVLPPKEE